MNKVFFMTFISYLSSQSIDNFDRIYDDLNIRSESSIRSTQKVFWDYFGGETCTFCPAVDMALSQLMDDYPNDVVTVTWADPYWSPFTDNDLCIYIDEIGSCHDIRENYYNMTTSRPHYRLQGNQWSGTGGGITSADSANMYNNTIRPITSNYLGNNSPYSLELNGYRDSVVIDYEITLTMDSFNPSENMRIEIVFVEDKVPTLYTGDGLVHGVRNLARHWVGNEAITIENDGESQNFSGELLMMDHVLWQISDDPPWNPENMKLVAIVQDFNNGDIYQSMELNVNEFDIDNDGVFNREDNCPFVSNPNQEDADDDNNGGNACDPCDNVNVYAAGNVYGDYWIYDHDIELSYQVNIFDFYRLLEIVENNDQESCGYEAGDLTGEGDVNIFDAYALLGFIIDGIL